MRGQAPSAESSFLVHAEWRRVNRNPTWIALWRRIFSEVTENASDSFDQSERL